MDTIPPSKNQNIQDMAFSVLLNNLNLGIFRQALDGKKRFSFVNETLGRLIGLPEKKLSQGRLSDLFEDKRHWRLLLKKILESKNILHEEVRLKTSSGKTLLCLASMVPGRGDKGKVTYVDGILQDISGLKRTEEELQESKELFQTVFNNSAAAIIVTDKEEKIIAWNPFGQRMLEMQREDLFNKPVRELYPPQEWRRMRALRIRQKGMLSNIETQILKKDGSILDVNISISVIKDPDGNITGTIGIMHDITKQKVAERKIKESENKIRIILDHSPVAIMVLDSQERIVSWNRFAEELLKMTDDVLYLKPVRTIYPPMEWQKIRKAGTDKAGRKLHLETKVVRQDGKEIDVDLSVNVLVDANKKVIGSVGIMRDVTREKHTKGMLLQAKVAAEEANRAKSLFLANMSHEVRTPMNTIMGMIDLTLDTDLAKDQRDNLSTVKDAADILLSLLNDILDLSRVEAGKIHLENIEVSISNIVKSVCKGMAVVAKNKGLNLEWEVDSQAPEMILGDPIRLRQVLVNLINNAIKFTFKGVIRVNVKLNQRIDDDNCELLFSVRDEGVGIPKDKLKVIFEAFTQADASTTRRFGGTGLGLSISKKLVGMMGGRIWAESEEFKGSTFFFTGKFRVVQKEDIPQALKEKSIEEEIIAQLPKRDLRHLSILLAEDNIVNQKMAIRMLEKKGWTVKAADNGRQVLDYLDKGAFDVILMDALMPVLDGYETTKIIREREKTTGEHIPIIALTARAMSGDMKKCLEVGMDGYVSKPIDREKLYDTIEKFFTKERLSNA